MKSIIDKIKKTVIDNGGAVSLWVPITLDSVYEDEDNIVVSELIVKQCLSNSLYANTNFGTLNLEMVIEEDDDWYSIEDVLRDIAPSNMNHSSDEIFREYCQWQRQETDIRVMLRLYFSRHLMDTSEQNKMACSICVEEPEAFGLSSNCMPYIEAIWQNPSEGTITFDMEGGNMRDFDDFDTDQLVQIMRDFDLFYNEH